MASNQMLFLLVVMMISLLVRSMVSQGPYSGHGVPPMHGDFEAQRHWMEITLNVPINDWYVGKAEGNDLQYWGLDYPPLTAFHSLACGKIMQHVSPSSVELVKSRGNESSETKTWMRFMALISDAASFIPAMLVYFATDKGSVVNYLGLTLAVNAPAFVLIDHGHFQFNCVAHGLVVLALTLLVRGNVTNGRLTEKNAMIASVLFCCAINFKQMSLYFAPLFFFHLLGWSFTRPLDLKSTFTKLTLLGMTVLATFGLIWSPFLRNGTALNVLKRMFPFERGIFEDKVANFWCSSNIIIKWKTYFSHQQLALLALAFTCLAITPACIKAFRIQTTGRQTILSGFIIALGFFLFSFQVHEKSVMLPLVPAVLLLDKDDELFLLGFWFAVVSSMSMFPLYLKDGIAPTSVFFTALYMLVAFLFKQDRLLKVTLTNVVSWLALLGLIISSGMVAFKAPPAKLPDLYVLVHNVLSFGAFSWYFAYANYIQWKPEIYNRLGGKQVDVKATGKKHL